MEKEFITEIDFPVPGPAVVSAFEKIGSRTAVTIAKLNLAGVVDYDAGQNRINRACLAVGCLGRTVFRLDTVETCLNGRAVDEDLARETAGLLARAVDQAIPGRYSQGYKRTAVQGMGLDLLAGLFPGRLKGGDHDRK